MQARRENYWAKTMRIAVIVLLQLVVTLFAGPLFAADNDPKNIAGYDKTVWGMSEDEVLAAEGPRAERLEKPSTMVNGDIVSIVIKELEVAGIQFSAYFIFDSQNRKLSAVGLQSVIDIGVTVETALSRIEKLLAETYGPATDNKTGKNILWELPKTTIELLGVDLKLPITSTKPIRMILISYRSTRGGNDASRQSL